MLTLIWLVVTAAAAKAVSMGNEGHCVMYGECATTAGLNCPYNGPAKKPNDVKFINALVAQCGERYRQSEVCCDAKQLASFTTQTKMAYSIIGACSACWKNLLDFWCDFTCSPNQAQFVNITSLASIDGDIDPSKGEPDYVTRVDYFVSPTFGEGFFNSCSSVKFGPDNSFAMSLIGGGADNYLAMMRFMGQKMPGFGSPFDIKFPDPNQHPTDVVYPKEISIPCDGSNGTEAYKCSCVDCMSSCPTLDPLDTNNECLIFDIPCIGVYGVSAFLVILFVLLLVYVLRLRKAQEDDMEQEEVVENEETRLLGDLDQGAPEIQKEDVFRNWFVHRMIEKVFYQIGYFSAKYPLAVLLSAIVVVASLTAGMVFLQVETEPINLWVSKSSEALQQKQLFDKSFGPFYRTQQIILSLDDHNSNNSIIQKEYVKQLFLMEEDIAKIVSPLNQTLGDFCVQPLKNGACVIQSVTGYWQENFKQFDRLTDAQFLVKFKNCVKTPTSCLPKFMQPLKADLIFGGFKENQPLNAKALIVTYVLANSLDATRIDQMEQWETSLLQYLTNVHQNPRLNLTNLKVSFSTENSIKREINRESTADIGVIAISYLIMFMYVSFSLGRYRSCKTLAVDSKIMLGVGGIVLVVSSVFSALGIVAYSGVKITMIIAEVIPFLILAVGIDNVFIIVHTFQRVSKFYFDLNRQLPVPERVAITMSECGPSILLSGLSESIAFGLGALVTMPAVRSFSIVAALAVWIDFCLQMTVFVAFLTLDARRYEGSYVDCAPCIRGPDGNETYKHSSLETIFEKLVSPMIVHTWFKASAAVVFSVLFVLSLLSLGHLEVGLDQRLALPRDSYLIHYFNDFEKYFRVGPPLYFVVQHNDPTSFQGQAQLCSRFMGCDVWSLSNILEQERKRPDISYIAQPTANWFDDFMMWLNPLSDSCCNVKNVNGHLTFCPSKGNGCETCFESDNPLSYNNSLAGLPKDKDFMKYLDFFLQAIPSSDCPLAGAAAYKDALVIDGPEVKVSHFRTYHTVLKTQSDFIQAYKAAKKVSEEIQTKSNNRLSVFPYSIYYVFFEQYLEINYLTMLILSCALAAMFLCSLVILGSFRAAFIITFVIIMILVDLMGLLMPLWNIQFNAVTLVNIVICVGISFEFCVHVTRTFCIMPAYLNIGQQIQTSGLRNRRIFKTMVEMGASIFSGITLTKLFGISVLYFSKSQIFEVFYFRMYLAIIILGASHGLLLLPILLSWFGPRATLKNKMVDRLFIAQSQEPSEEIDIDE